MITSFSLRISRGREHDPLLVAVPSISTIRAAADEMIVVNCPGDNSIIRSRFLKFTMRSLVGGRFVYLDSDTIVMRSPDSIWSIGQEVAAGPDLAPNGKDYNCSNAAPYTCAALGWTLGSRLYLNAGVVYFADSEAAR